MVLEQTSHPSTPAIPLAEAKSFFREDRDIENSLIESLVLTAEKTISNHLGIHFTDTDFTLHLKEFKDIRVPKRPYKPGSLTVEYDDADGVTQILQPDNYHLLTQESPVFLEFKQGIPFLKNEKKYPVRIKFTVGYGTQIPADLKTAIKLLALIYWKRDIPMDGDENLNPMNIKLVKNLLIDKKLSRFK